MKFIVVDDEEVMRDSIARFLEQKGHICEIASSGREAMEIIDREGTDVVVTDLNMPEMTGLILLKAIKDRYPKIKVILLTAFATYKNAAKASEYGAYGFCSKSDDLTRFTKIVNQIAQDGNLPQANGATPESKKAL